MPPRKKSPDAPNPPPYYWRRIMPGQSYAGREYDQGEGVEIGKGGNDPKLIKLGYVAEWPDGTEPLLCGECGKLFVEEQYRQRHGRMRHAGMVLHYNDSGDVIDPDEERKLDQVIEAEAARMEREVPFYKPDEPPEVLRARETPVTIPAGETPVA